MELRRSAHKNPYVDRIRSIWLFSDCSTKELELVDSLCTWAQVPEGRCLTRQGEYSGQFFVIARGVALATVDHRPFALIEAGSFFGDMALLGVDEYRATVTAATHMDLLAFSRLECMQLSTAAIPCVQAKIDVILAERQFALAEVARGATMAGLFDEKAAATALTGYEPMGDRHVRQPVVGARS